MAKKLKELGREPYGTQGRTKYMVLVECDTCSTKWKISKDDYTRNPACVCKPCANRAKGLIAKQAAADSFVGKAEAIHGKLHNYSLVVYESATTKVQIICPTHGIFDMRPTNHLNGQGCPKCGKESMALTQAAAAKATFVSRASAIHRGEYIYSNTNYTVAHAKVDIECRIHGTFSQIANDHLHGSGCPNCKASSDMDAIYVWNVVDTDTYKIGITSARLDVKRIKYVAQQLGTDFITNLVCQTTNAIELEKYIHATFVQCPIDLPKQVNGYTEFRVLTEEQLQQVLDIIHQGK